MTNMFSPGLSDSIANVIGNAPSCPHCDSSSHIAGGLCVGCLLEAGLDPAEEADSDSLSDILAEVKLPDQNWRLGNYEILEEIGRGGMGVIYRARQRHSRRIVAVKRVLSYHADSRETLARFRREAQAAASLDHPNILPIYEVSESEDGLPFFSMKFAPGGSLQQMARALRDDPRQCVALVAKITRAVQYAHNKGILHRDLKPGNILLDGRGEPLVSDFGLAKWLDTASDLTRTLTIFGTPGYIAPEQASHAATELKPTADVYSLGAILFDLLAGRPPFLGAHALSVIRQAAESPAPKLRTLSKLADRDLETICSRCLERDPKLRYPSAHDLAEDLERWLEGRPIIARPVSPPIKIWRWSRRNPVLAGAATVCVLVAALALARQAQNWRLETKVTAQTAAQHSIQVIPFLDLDSARLSEGTTRAMAAELTEALKPLGPATVTTSSTSSAGGNPPRAIFSGTLRTINGKLRISLHLLDSNTHKLLLHRMIEPTGVSSEKFAARVLAHDTYSLLSNADLTNVGESVSDPGLIDTETRNFINAGVELSNRRGGLDLDRAIACLNHAIELQPGSCAAHAALAKALTFKAAYQSNREPLARALEVARKAIALDNSNGEAHLALAAVFHHSGKLQESLDESLTALEYSPNSRRASSLLANTCKAIGRPDMALRWYAVGKDSERNPGENDAAIGDCYSYLLDDARAEASYQHYFKLHPEQPDGWMGICRLRILNGKFSEARAIYQQETRGYADFAYSTQMAAQVEFFARNFPEAEKLYGQLAEKDPNGGGTFYASVSYQSALGRLRLAQENESGRLLLLEAKAKEMAEVIASPRDPDAFYRLAAIEASLGESDAALAHLRTAIDAGWIDYRSFDVDPRFDSIRHVDSYRALINSMSLRVESLRDVVP